MKDQLERIRQKIRAKGWHLKPPMPESAVAAFESAHGIALPAAYRAFIIEIGNGCEGPPEHGLVPLGAVPPENPAPKAEYWVQLPDITKPFPFTKPWIWEEEELSAEGREADVTCGSLCLGTDGDGLFWHLIVTGPERGNIWQFTGVGIQPLAPQRDFLQWMEDALEDKDPFREYPKPTKQPPPAAAPKPSSGFSAWLVREKKRFLKNYWHIRRRGW